MSNSELKEARKKALLSPNIGKRGLGKKTKDRIELRKQFIEYFGERFIFLLEKLETAVKQGNMAAILEVLRQLIGSAEQKTDIDLNINKAPIWGDYGEENNLPAKSLDKAAPREPEQVEGDSGPQESGKDDSLPQPSDKAGA